MHAQVWRALRDRWVLAASIILGSLMHAVGHAFLAGAAGLLARALVRGDGPMDLGSTTVASPSRAAAFGLGGPSIDVGLGGGAPDRAALALATFGFFAAIAKLVGGALASWAEARVAGDVGANVRLAVLDEVLAVDGRRGTRQEDHGSATRGDRLAALTTHVHDVEQGVAQGVLAEVRALLQLLPLAALLVVLAPKLAASAVVALGGFGVLAFSVRRAFKRAHARASVSAGALVLAADEAVKHAELWATYGAKRRIRAHVSRIGRAIARETARIRIRASLLSSTSEVLGALALVLVLVLASRGALGVANGTVVPFAIAFFMAYRPLRDLVDARLARSRGDEALRRALAGAAPERHPAEGPTTGRKSTSSGAWALEPLVLEGVCTRHGGHAPLSTAIPAGAVVAIVGPTGIGKTSLLRALLGLDPLAAGEVRYGNERLSGRGVGPSERPFAWVPQDAPVVGDTLAINVGLGRADDDAAVPDPVPVLAELGAEGLVLSLGDDVLATVRSLSGGERQWIAVARALATGLPILLLDEPTSALDEVSQARLLRAIARLRGKRTVLVVTHRPEPLAIVDAIIRLEPATPDAGERAHERVAAQ